MQRNYAGLSSVVEFCVIIKQSGMLTCYVIRHWIQRTETLILFAVRVSTLSVIDLWIDLWT